MGLDRRAGKDRVRDRKDAEEGDVDHEPRLGVIEDLGVEVDVEREQWGENGVRVPQIDHEARRAGSQG